MTATPDHRPIWIFGEVLVDQFPDGQRVLGGAPFNVAWHLSALGRTAQLISSVGRDSDGDSIRSAMAAWGMDLSGLQISDRLPTGIVSVALRNGQPTYDILEGRAFDAIDNPEISGSGCSLLYHGTLALRSQQSRSALQALRKQSGAPVFMDVNLRDPWWDRSSVLRLADESSWVKLNDDELGQLGTARGDTRTAARHFLETHSLDGVIVTRGALGAFAMTREGQLYQADPNPAIAVVDTVGAGDGFAAVMLAGITSGWPIGKSLQRAQEFASLIVQNRGAILHDKASYEGLAANWK